MTIFQKVNSDNRVGGKIREGRHKRQERYSLDCDNSLGKG